ncbi:MAG: serine/threonine protein kinase [Gemmataceae bacterium]|nr:serine/threonine protein kinase [Gemmataceae bacterium]
MVGRVFLGRYEALRLLGEGGMGRVYLARQLDLGRSVVIKVMHDHIAADPKFIERFQRETLLMARFQHPYAVTLYDASINDPQGPCIIMEYIKGVTLDQLLMRNGRLSPVRTGRLLVQLCEVLQAAHGGGIIHRDLKPANLMVLEADTPYEKIKVMDFGLAKLVQGSAVDLKKITESNMEFAVGTPGYICPEQVRGEEADHRGDLYSVGIIMYEMLTGRLPFAGRSTMDILLAHATEPPPSFDEIGARDWVPPTIEAVVNACLAKDPKDRPQSARDLAERYETALAHVEKALNDELPPEHPRAQLEKPVTPARPAENYDPRAVVHHLEAWMPEKIAVYKLRGFVQDAGGAVVESTPGLIRVRLGKRGSIYQAPGVSWFGFTKAGQIDMELRLQQADTSRGNKLHITVVLTVVGHNAAEDAEWHARCDQVFIDLRAYLMGNTGTP